MQRDYCHLVLRNVTYCTVLYLIVTVVLLVSARADWKDDLGRFRIGIIGGHDTAHAIGEIEPFRLAVEEKLGVPVSVIPYPDLSALVRGHVEGRNEYAVLPASVFAAGWVNCECIEPLVAAKSSDGASGVYSILITRKQSGLASPADLIGKTIFALGKDTTLGYAFPVRMLQRQGVDFMAADTKFVFAQSGEAANRRFAAGEGDAIFGWTSKIGDLATGYTRGTLTQLEEIKPGIASDLQVIWTSSLVPHHVHSIRKNLAAEPKRLLKELLPDLFDKDPVAYDAVEKEFGGGFSPITQSDFSDLQAFAKNPVPQKSVKNSEPQETDKVH